MHAHGHTQAPSGDRRLLALSLGLILAFMAVEVVFGFLANSLALLADAGHMLTDAAALALALFAAWAASLPARGRWTFGFGRAEILAAQANGVTLVVVGIVILAEGIRRLVDPPDVQGGVVTVVALAGVAVNLAVLRILAGARRESLNIRGAYLHIATDLAAFAGTAVAGFLDPRHRLGPLRPGRVAARRGAHVRSRVRAPEGVGPDLPRGRAGVGPTGRGRQGDRRPPRGRRGA